MTRTALAEPAHQQRTARAVIPRCGRVAVAPVAIGARNAARRAGAQDRELQKPGHGRGIRSKRSKNISEML